MRVPFLDTGNPQLADFAFPIWKQLDILLASLLITLVSLSLPLGLLQVYDRILPNQSYSTTIILTGAITIAIVMEMALRLIRSYLMTRRAAKFEYKTAIAAFDRMLRADIGVFERIGPGEHLECFNAVNNVRDFYAGQILLTLLDLVFAGLYLLLIYILGGTLVLIPLTIIGTCLLAVLVLGKGLHHSILQHNLHENKYSNYLISVLGSMHSVKALAIEASLQRRNEHLQELRANSKRDMDSQSASLNNLAMMFGQVAMVSVVGYGSTLVINGQLSVGGLAACTLLVGRSLQPMQAAIGFWSRFQNIKAARDRVEQLLNLPTSLESQLVDDPSPKDIEGTVELRDICFSYSAPGPEVLKQINLQLKAGEMLAITGSNGSGKTTLLSIIRGLLMPVTGQVLIDGRPLAEHDKTVINQRIAYLPQNEAIFRGTIMENITMFSTEREELALGVADWLGFKAEINSYPKGFRTNIGESSGVMLPRGLAQRIAIARTLVMQPKILLFDEANTAIDEKSDQALKATLEKLHGKCTIIIVTHRPSIMWLADRVHDLCDGRMEEHGLVVNGLVESA